jgi:hypothetical protein
MRTITSYGIAVIIVLAIINGIAWLVGTPILHDLNVFSAGIRAGDARHVYCGLAVWKSPVTCRT